MWSAKFETRHVEIEGYGPTEKEAVTVLRRLWKIVCFREGYDPHIITESRDDINTHEIVAGHGLVDGCEEEVNSTNLLIDGEFVPIRKVSMSMLRDELRRPDKFR